jgi:hypothetical protein
MMMLEILLVVVMLVNVGVPNKQSFLQQGV